MRLPFRAPAPVYAPPQHRVCAVGDVHGCADQLDTLLSLIGAEQPERIVFLGDYIDRGPDTARAIAIVRHLPRTICLLGNHEAMFLAALDDPAHADHWLANGGFATLDSFGIPPETPAPRWRERLPAGVEQWLRGLPLSHRAGDYLFVHAGVRPGVALDAQSAQDLLWIREPFLSYRAPHPWRVVHGHTVTEAPVLCANRVGVDTGAAFGGRLTAAVIDADGVRFLSV